MSGQLCPKKNCFVLSLKCAPLKNSGKISFFCNCFLILFFLTCIMYKKSLEKEKPKLSCNNWWNLSKFSPKFFKSSICARKESQGGSVFKTFKIFGPTLAYANIAGALAFLHFLHLFFCSCLFKTYIPLERAFW